MAKIVRFHRIGEPEVLKIEEVPSRESRKGETKLRVQPIGLNRADSTFMRGYYLEPTQLSASLGYEAAGVVAGVGLGVDPGWLNKSVSIIPAFSLNQCGVVGDEVTKIAQFSYADRVAALTHQYLELGLPLDAALQAAEADLW
jgi:NADPH:quinone reductase-like Zn-dependent oxidoreductase